MIHYTKNSEIAKKVFFTSIVILASFSGSCKSSTSESQEKKEPDIQIEKVKETKPLKPKELTSNDIVLTKDIVFDKYTLNDTYPYKDTTRVFQWNIVKEKLAFIENYNDSSTHWLVFQNYKNLNGEAPLIAKHIRNKYNHVADTLGTERYQSVPLYQLNDTIVPTIYGQDGALARYFAKEGSFMEVNPLYRGGKWLVPTKYVKLLPDSIIFNKVIIVDRTNQNIATLERVSRGHWKILSMNPATTGKSSPPYQYPTPLGIFVIQQKKEKMIFNKDGSNEPGGFSPYANRFTNGGYIHGVPINYPNTKIVDFSPTLGTTPRSHMCVRTATSMAKFIYDWETVYQTLVIVIN